jgi:hypothetical protein
MVEAALLIICCALAVWFTRGCPVNIVRHNHAYDDPTVAAEKEARALAYEAQLSEVKKAEDERKDALKDLIDDLNSFMTEE